MQTASSTTTGLLDSVGQQRMQLHVALVRLEGVLAAAPHPYEEPWRDALLDRLVELRDALSRHVEVTEHEGDGLFADVLTQAPRLESHVEHLRHDHRDLERDLDLLIARTHEDTLARLHDEASRLAAHLARHRADGADLVYEAYEIDLAATD